MTKVDISRFYYENLVSDNRRLRNEVEQVTNNYAVLRSNYKSLVNHQLEVVRYADGLTQENFEYQTKILELEESNNYAKTRINELRYELKYDMAKEEVSPSAMRFIKDYTN